jgi:hypothetical protein
MTEVAATPEEVRIYLKRVLSIDPDNAPARKGLELLDRAGEPLPVTAPALSDQALSQLSQGSPEALTEVQPEEFRAGQQPSKGNRWHNPKTAVIIAVAAISAVLLLIIGYALYIGSRSSVPQQTYSLQKQPEPVTTGLNVSTLEVKSAMEGEGYDFKSVNPAFWEGTSPTDNALLDLYGSPTLLGGVLMFGPSADTELMRQISKEAGAFIGAALPTWQDSSRWIADHLEDVFLTGKEASTIHNGVPIRISRLGTEDTFVAIQITIGNIP